MSNNTEKIQSRFDCSESTKGDIVCLRTPSSLLTPVRIREVKPIVLSGNRNSFLYEYCHNPGLYHGNTYRPNTDFIPFEIVMMAISDNTKVTIADINHRGCLSPGLANNYFMDAFQRLKQEDVYQLITNCFNWHKDKFRKFNTSEAPYIHDTLPDKYLTFYEYKFFEEMLHIWSYKGANTLENDKDYYLDYDDKNAEFVKVFYDSSSKTTTEDNNTTTSKGNDMPNQLFKVTAKGDFLGHYGEFITKDGDGFTLLKMVSLSKNSDVPVIQAFKPADLDEVRPWTFSVRDSSGGSNRSYVANKDAVSVGDVFVNGAGNILTVTNVDTKADTSNVLKAFKLAGEMFDSTISSPLDEDEPKPDDEAKAKPASKAKK